MGLQYRFAAIAGIATQFFWGIMMIMMYEAYFEAGIDTPMAWNELISYIWLGQAFLMLTNFRLDDPDIKESIVSGQVAYELIRPYNIYFFWFVQLITKKITNVLMRFWPIVIFTALLPAKYALGAPISIGAFILFILTLMLGAILSVSLLMIIYVLMFYTTSSKGLISIYGVVADFFAGGVIPIPFMPKVLQIISYILPFRLVTDLPYRLYTGNISISEGMISVFVQCAWILISTLIGAFIMKNASKRIVVQGG